MDNNHHLVEHDGEEVHSECVKFSDISVHDLHFILTVFILGPISVLGIVVNFLCLLILSRDGGKSIMAFLLLMLAIADGMFILFDFATMTAPALASMGPLCKNISPESKQNFRVALPYLLTTLEVARTFGVWMVAVIMVTRYVDVYDPMRSSSHCSVECIRKQIIALAIYCAIFNIPRFFELRRQCHGHGDHHGDDDDDMINPNVTIITTTTAHDLADEGSEEDKCLNHMNFAIPYNILILTFNHIIPLLIVISLTCKLALGVRKAGAKRVKLTPREAKALDQGMHVTRALVILATIFMICQLPMVGFMSHHIFRRIYPSLEPQWDSDSKSLFTTIVFYLFQDVNSCSKFFVYFFTGKKFRRNVLQMVSCCAVRRMAPSRSMTSGYR